jgi:hypothetical protein
MIDYVGENDLIYEELQEKIDLLFEYVQNEDEALFNQTIGEIRNMNLPDDRNQSIRRTFIEIFDASSDFWNNLDCGEIEFRWGWRDIAVIVADAAGGAAGTSIAGPWGGAYLGAHSSIAVGGLVNHI